MSPSPNRSRLTVDLGGDWRAHVDGSLPVGARGLGTVTLGDRTGALICMDGLYVIAERGTTAWPLLHQRKTKAALQAARAGHHGGPGRGGGRRTPDGDEPMTRHQVYLDAQSLERLRALGDGQLSLGIRRAAAALG